MEKKSIRQSLPMLIELYDYHTQLFHNVIEGISEADANNRLNTKANHPAWLTGSLVEGRFVLAGALGIKVTQQANVLFKNNHGIQENVTYPALGSFVKDWEFISPVLKDALENADDGLLEGPEPFGMGANMTLFDAIVFCTDRESYCIGQIGLWRRLLGYPAMKYPE